MKNIFYILIITLLFLSCEKNDNKIWKHGVYSKWQAKELEDIFNGLEVDVIYSPEKNNIYVGRVLDDTTKKLLLDDWFSVLKEPNKLSYWIDFKNLSKDNAQQAMDVLNDLAKKYNVKEKVFVESKDLKALKIVKDNEFLTMLWVGNFNYWKSQQRKDSVYLAKLIRSQIDELHPDAISCDYTLFQFLCDSFPEQNIHLWDTPKEFTPENVEFTKKLCKNKSVKVVLVDYPTPEIF